jgi:hypothetical protein
LSKNSDHNIDPLLPAAKTKQLCTTVHLQPLQAVCELSVTVARRPRDAREVAQPELAAARLNGLAIQAQVVISARQEQKIRQSYDF